MQGKWTGGALSREGRLFYVDFLLCLVPLLSRWRQRFEVFWCGLGTHLYAIAPADGPALHNLGIHPYVTLGMLDGGPQNAAILR